MDAQMNEKFVLNVEVVAKVIMQEEQLNQVVSMQMQQLLEIISKNPQPLSMHSSKATENEDDFVQHNLKYMEIDG